LGDAVPSSREAVSLAAVVVAVFAAVLTAELLGDKIFLAIASLSAQYRPSAILGGLLPAQMAKMAVAVLAGGFVARLPVTLVTMASVLTFALTAVALWRKRCGGGDAPTRKDGVGSSWRGVALGFGAVFFTEWADPGQLAAAAMVARYGRPWVVWGAATGALAMKGLLALTLGRGLRRYIPHTALRISAAGVCAVLAVLAALAIR